MKSKFGPRKDEEIDPDDDRPIPFGGARFDPAMLDMGIEEVKNSLPVGAGA